MADRAEVRVEDIIGQQGSPCTTRGADINSNAVRITFIPKVCQMFSCYT